MAEQSDPVDVVEQQLTAITDTHGNLAGLIQKTTRIQAELAEAGLEDLADRIGLVFASLSDVAEELQKVLHDVEIERNRLRTQG
jgi:DNA repair ATPase RecN